MTAPQPSTPEEFAGDCDCPYPRHQSMCSACKLAARIRERDAALLAPLRAEVERLATAANAHESCKESWRECLPPGNDVMFGPDIARHWKSRAERAEAENARLRAALQPFQRIIADNVLGPQRSDGQKFTLAEAKDDDIDFDFTVGDFRAAARALAEGGGE